MDWRPDFAEPWHITHDVDFDAVDGCIAHRVTTRPFRYRNTFLDVELRYGSKSVVRECWQEGDDPIELIALYEVGELPALWAEVTWTYAELPDLLRGYRWNVLTDQCEFLRPDPEQFRPAD